MTMAQHPPWVSLLNYEAPSARYWHGGKIPEARQKPPRRTRGVCPGGPLVDTDPANKLGQRDWPECQFFWPPTGPRCHVYSIGVANQWGFEDSASTRCSVHAYDPTKQLKKVHEAHRRQNVHFHYRGLGGETSRGVAHPVGGGGSGNVTVRRTSVDRSNVYGSHSLASLRTLNELVAGNAGQPLPDVLKIDCEGCEWVALLQVARRTPSILNRTSLLLLEVHVAASMASDGITSEHASEVFKFLLDILGFRVWWMRDNPGHKRDQRIARFGRKVGLRNGQCCYELALARRLSRLT